MSKDCKYAVISMQNLKSITYIISENETRRQKNGLNRILSNEQNPKTRADPVVMLVRITSKFQPINVSLNIMLVGSNNFNQLIIL